MVEDYYDEAIKIITDKSALCFEGGGILGIGHIGALSKLHELGGLRKITHVVGTSVGSIVASALGCGASIEYIQETLFDLKLKEFKDSSNCVILDLVRFIRKWGWYRGQKVENFAGKVMQDLTGNSDITFLEAYEKFGIQMTIVYLSIRYKKTRYADHITMPNLKIKKAVQMSAAIPAFYQTIAEDEKNRKKDLFVDGGITDNFPIHVLKDQGCKPIDILGFKLCTKEEFNEYKEDLGEDVDEIDYGLPKHVYDHFMRLIGIVHSQALRYHVHSADWKLTTKIDIGKLTTTDFDISEEEKLWLYNQGRDAMDNHVKEVMELLSKDEYPLE